MTPALSASSFCSCRAGRAIWSCSTPSPICSIYTVSRCPNRSAPSPRGATPIRYLHPPAGVNANQQRRTLDFVNRLNQEHLRTRADDSELAARIAAYELAFRMQSHAPEVVDTTRESQATRRLYGLDRP